jgi:PAS domain S-box-containing protein
MKDENKTKKQLIDELGGLRQRITNLGKSETERKRVEVAVREALRYAESIVETVREPLMVLNMDLKILSANRSFYNTFKVTPDETVGNFIYDLGNRQWDIPRLRTLFEDILPKNTKFDNFQVDHDFPIIGRKIMLLNARRINRKDLSTQMILLAIEDITERRRREEELKKLTGELARSNADLQQFAYAASHDLQEPLRVIAGFVKLLEKRYKHKLDTKAQEFIDFTIDGVKRMQQLIKNLLEYSKVGTKGLNFKPTDCSFVVDESISNLRAAIEETGILVTHDELPTLIVDASLMTRLFQNLIGNAIKFHGEQPLRVHVSAERKRNEWVFSVQDNGIGINPQHIERIFDVFRRLHTKEEYPGTGIGLAICKRIVERLGGRIWVKSEPEKGSTFYFTIPYKEGNIKST